jgi:hypothetical protein
MDRQHPSHLALHHPGEEQSGLARIQYRRALIEKGSVNLTRYSVFQIRWRIVWSWFLSRTRSLTRSSRSSDISLRFLAILESSVRVYRGKRVNPSDHDFSDPQRIQGITFLRMRCVFPPLVDENRRHMNDGISLETQDIIADTIYTGSNTSLQNLVKLLGPNGILRVGGTSQDTGHQGNPTPALTQRIANDLAGFNSALGSGWSLI